MKALVIFPAFLVCALVSTAQYSLKRFDINQGTVQGGSSYAGGFTSFKGKTYFYATDGIHGNELWWSDGDNVGMVADIRTGGTHGVTTNSEMCVLGDKLYFSADDSVLGHELFEYDGIQAPHLAADVAPGAAEGYPDNFVVSNGLLYFSANYGTQGRQVFAYNPVNQLASPVTISLSNLTNATVLGNKLVLGATNFPYHVEPCEYNMADNSFKMIQDLNAGIDGSHPTQFMTAFNRVFFVAMTPANGVELYQYMGTGAPKMLTGNLNPGSSNSVAHTPGFRRHLFRQYNNKLYFAGNVGGSGYGLCYYDPNVGNTSVVYPMAGTQAASEFEEYHGRLFFSTDSNKNGINSLYAYDGSAVSHMSAFGVPASFSNPRGTTASNGRLFFSADAGDNEVYVFTDSAALGVRSLLHAAAIASVYPNPAGEKAFLKISLQQAMQLEVRLTDVQGRTAYRTELKAFSAGSHDIELVLDQLSAAHYIYTIVDKGGNVLHAGKLVKE